MLCALKMIKGVVILATHLVYERFVILYHATVDVISGRMGLWKSCVFALIYIAVGVAYFGRERSKLCSRISKLDTYVIRFYTSVTVRLYLEILGEDASYFVLYIANVDEGVRLRSLPEKLSAGKVLKVHEISVTGWTLIKLLEHVRLVIHATGKIIIFIQGSGGFTK